jgi:hypothetical protein
LISLNDLLAVMDRWELWKSTRDNAAKVPELEQRIAALEAMLNGKRPGDVCPKCGARTFRVFKAYRERDGRSLRSYKCEDESCGFLEQRVE